MNIYKYDSKEQYRSIQEAGNIKKLDCVFVNKKVVDCLSEYIKENIVKPSFGICHGTRRGVEQKLFAEKTGAKVIGTEISSTATQFPDTIQWDFHNIKDEWINNVDFIYSNSIDHSYDPIMALSQWLSCLKDNGLCFIEYTYFNKKFTKLDCFSSSREEMVNLISEVGYLHDTIIIKGIHQASPTRRARKITYIIFVVKKKVIK